jgi:hypothetical protein
MAELVNKIIGSARGKVGDVVFKRHKNGKVFFSTHKGYNEISKSKKCVENRTRFNRAVNFAKAVNSLPELREVWKSSNIEGRSAYTKIMSNNIKLFHDTNPARTNKITPHGFGFHADNLILTNNSVSIDIKLIENFNELKNTKFSANFVVALFERKPGMDEYSFPYAVAISDYTPVADSQYQNITANFNTFESDNVNAYAKALVFIAFTNIETKPYIYSSSLGIASEIIQT